jgi:hypothetical protein
MAKLNTLDKKAQNALAKQAMFVADTFGLVFAAPTKPRII